MHHRRHCPHQRPRCRWCRYPDGTPLHQRTAYCVALTAATLGLWGVIWAGLAIRHRWGNTGAWIYVGTWCIAGILGQLTPPPAPPAPTHQPVIVVTVTATPGTTP